MRSLFLPSFHPIPIFSCNRRLTPSFSFPSIISCKCERFKEPEEKENSLNYARLLQFSVTLTVISSSIPQALAHAKVAEKKRASKKSPEALSPNELKAWSRGLPTVANRIPYTELLKLREEGKLKHIVKLPTAPLRQRADPVLAVLDDSMVVRTVLPTIERDSKFWESWDSLQLNSLCINAYTPPVKKPELPSPYLGFLSKVPTFIFTFIKPKPKSKRALELERERKELAARRKAELATVREERRIMEKALINQKKMEDRKRRLEERKAKYKDSLKQARKNYQTKARKWASLARDQNVATVLGLLFFFVFYRTVVLSYRKQRKDYEDRLKIEKAEAEERKKLRQLEKEMTGLEDAVEDEGEEREGEQNPYLQMAKKFMRSGARVRRAHSKRLPQYMERGVDVKFKDVAGLGNIRLELEEIVKFFTMGEVYRRRGVKIPGGILLCGPPGVGKTLLAKAVAGEAGVNFFSISASQFVEIYVGVGASRVRALYQEARDNAPSVVFIDELDAVGRERGLIKGSGGQERDATLNQLLVCLDGFEGRGDVITIAATNRPDILDPALVRPGRFDRKIYIPKPSLAGRVEILKITTDDLLQAAQIEERGMLDKKERSEEMWKRLALNEAAMAVVAVNFPDLKNIEFVTISPRAGRELGYVRVKMDHLKFSSGMLRYLSTIWAETADNARSAARSFVLGGLSEKFYGLADFWVVDRINEIDLEALHILSKCYERANKILKQNRILMDKVVDELVTKKSLTKQEFFHLVEENGQFDPYPPSIVDIRNAKRVQFQEMMMSRK
ncbi:hypothetical protein KFK09_003965 [Dendrobium nobile]|uniref:AAA+ ATPase domain-containing protein n=1 Tax=Dendrobium nobile TaxID=94219 RepID=A0A8T3C4X8_DENNO|nr:hypothetical protein KFK09_003965 [Dendrobium nobile]